MATRRSRVAATRRGFAPLPHITQEARGRREVGGYGSFAGCADRSGRQRLRAGSAGAEGAWQMGRMSGGEANAALGRQPAQETNASIGEGRLRRTLQSTFLRCWCFTRG